MAIVVVGGHTRNVGKTSVAAGLIAALREFRWSAMKITQHGHGICSADGHPCHCANDDHSWAISEEKDTSGKSDTSRFLVAGAHPVWWVRTQQGKLAEAMPAIRRRVEACRNMMIESNSVLKFLRPDVYLTVLDPSVADFKASAQEFLDRADAVLLHDPREHRIEWANVSLGPVAGRPIFQVLPPAYVTSEVVEFVRSALNARLHQ